VLGRTVTGVTVALLCAAPAYAQTGGTAPSYPGNTLRLEQSMRMVAGTVVTVRLSGHAEWNEPTDASTIGYTVSVYAQNADVHPSCETSYSAQLGKAINLPTLGASEAITDWVVSDTIRLNPDPPSSGVDWSIDSLPFVISPGVENLLLCGYQRYVIDDAAWFQLPVKVEAPACTLQPRRGRRLRVRCNARGRMTLRFTRPRARARTITATVGESGTQTISTRRLRPGVYRVRITSGGLDLGTRRLRITRAAARGAA
jgi:hypothetical protein